MDEKTGDQVAKRRAFVAWDSQTRGGVQTLLDLLDESPPDGWDVFVPCLDQHAGGIWRTIVEPRLRRAEMVLGLVDLPNANVGFEIGYALGLAGLAEAGKAEAGPKKRVRLASATPVIPAWVANHAPFKGQAIAQGSTTDELEGLVADGQSIEKPAPLRKGERTVLLCPEAGPGAGVRKRLGIHAPAWKLPDTTGWEVPDLPKVLDGVRRVVWVILAYPGEPQRDGPENAAAGVIAGYALANGVDLKVWRQREARDVVDVGVAEKAWTRVKELDALVKDLGEIEALGGDHVDALTLYRRYLREVHEALVPFFSHVDRPLGDVYVELALDLRCGPFDDEGGDGELTAPGSSGKRDPRQRAIEFPKSFPSRPSLRDLLGQPIEGGLTGRYVVLGMPGAGKSTVCRHLCFELAGDKDGVVPVFFSLPRLARAGNKSPFDLAEDDLAKAHDAATAKGFSAELRRLAEQGKVWLLADGLDEVPEEEMPRVRDCLEALAKDPSLKNARLVVTTRDVGYEALPAPFVRAQLRPLEEKDVRGLLGNWLGDAATGVWERIQRAPRLLEIANNPLMLTLIAMLAKLTDSALPPTKTALYEHAVRLLLKRGHGREAKGVRDPLLAEKVLAPLSLKLHESEQETWTEEEVHDALGALCDEREELRKAVAWWGSPSSFLEDVAHQSGLLGPYGGGNEPWRYMHRSLREYLAACALQDDDPAKRLRHLAAEGTTEAESEEKADPDHAIRHWAETYALVVGLLKSPEDRLEMLGRLRTASDDLILRVLPQIDGLDAGTAFGALVATDGWDGDHLLALVRGWLVDGVPPDEIRKTIWAGLNRAGIKDAAHRFYALRWASISYDEDAFYREAGLPPREERPVIDAVRLPPNDQDLGEFWMGSPEGEGYDHERPRHRVTLSPFRIGTAPVTEGEYARFDPRHADKSPDLPVTRVSWWEAWLFAQWLGGDLPTEAQWEYACRAGTETRWWTGDNEADLTDAAWFSENSEDAVHPVRTKNCNPWGLFDVHGNVWEWCGDWFGTYSAGEVHDPGGAASGSRRVWRGGSYWDTPDWLRSAYRSWYLPGNRGSGLGFRVVLPPSELR